MDQPNITKEERPFHNSASKNSHDFQTYDDLSVARCNVVDVDNRFRMCLTAVALDVNEPPVRYIAY